MTQVEEESVKSLLPAFVRDHLLEYRSCIDISFYQRLVWDKFKDDDDGRIELLHNWSET